MINLVKEEVTNMVNKHITIKRKYDYQYYGIFLDERTKNILILRQYQTDDVNYNLMLDKAKQLFIKHCTLMHRSQHDDFLKQMLDKDLGKTFHITLTGIGFSDKAIAFRVQKTGIVINCKNKVPHITIATLGDGKPVDSNDITEWKDINPITITGKLRRI